MSERHPGERRGPVTAHLGGLGPKARRPPGGIPWGIPPGIPPPIPYTRLPTPCCSLSLSLSLSLSGNEGTELSSCPIQMGTHCRDPAFHRGGDLLTGQAVSLVCWVGFFTLFANPVSSQNPKGSVTHRASARLDVTTAFELGDSLVLQGTPSQPLFSISDPLFVHGRLYVTDFIGNKVLEFDRSGRLIRTVGQKGTGPGEFQMPYGVATDNTGRIYVNDRGNARVQVFDADLRHIAIYKVGGQQEQIFIRNEGPTVHVLAQGVTRCDGPAGCLLTDITLSDKGMTVSDNRTYSFVPVDAAPVVFTWRATVAPDGVVYIANVFGDSVATYSLTGQRLGAFPLRSPSRSIPPGLQASASSAELGVLMHRLRDERYTRLSSLVVADSIVFVQYERVNPSAGESPGLLDIFTPTGCLLYAAVPTPGRLTANGGSLHFVSRQEGGYGRVVIVPLRLKKALPLTSCPVGGIG